MGVLTFWWLGLLLWFLCRSFIIRGQRERYLDKCDKRYEAAFDMSRFKYDKPDEKDLPEPPTVYEFNPSYRRGLRRRSSVIRRKYLSTSFGSSPSASRDVFNDNDLA